MHNDVLVHFMEEMFKVAETEKEIMELTPYMINSSIDLPDSNDIAQ